MCMSTVDFVSEMSIAPEEIEQLSEKCLAIIQSGKYETRNNETGSLQRLYIFASTGQMESILKAMVPIFHSKLDIVLVGWKYKFLLKSEERDTTTHILSAMHFKRD